MKLKDLLEKRNEIANGHFNELRSKMGLVQKDEEQIFLKREKICDACPLKNGNSCNTLLWINPLTLEVSNMPKKGFIRGCGCRLTAKQKSKQSSCPAGFWGGEFE